MLTVEEFEALQSREVDDPDGETELEEVAFECPYCEGKGLQDDDCPICIGTGIPQFGPPDRGGGCSHCRGTGVVVPPPCGECDGDGIHYLQITPEEKVKLGEHIVSDV